MTTKSQRWKNSERSLAEVYQKYKIPAKRISRGSNYSFSTFDVEIENQPNIISDSKYSVRGFKVNRLLGIVEEKYKKVKEAFCILYTKGYREHGGCMTVSDELLAMLLSYWLGYSTKEELLKIYLGENNG